MEVFGFLANVSCCHPLVFIISPDCAFFVHRLYLLLGQGGLILMHGHLGSLGPEKPTFQTFPKTETKGLKQLLIEPKYRVFDFFKLPSIHCLSVKPQLRRKKLKA